MANEKLSIAITIRNDVKPHQVFYGNGLSQNVKFLYDILKLIGHKPFFLVGNPQPKNVLNINQKPYKAYSFQEVLKNEIPVKIALESGVSIHKKFRDQIQHKYGTKTAAIRYGHTMFMDMEQICYKETLQKGLYISKPDIVLASPHFENSFSYLETIYQAPVKTIPYIWEPDFVETSPFTISDYKRTPDIFVMEPNISMLKNALIPLAIIERLFRDAPDEFRRATILNGTGFNSQEYFLDNIVKNMTSMLAQNKKVFFTQRYNFDAVFKQRDVLLGHQYGCELNYLYLEALHKNVPLVHNSPSFKGAGYYYPDFRVDLGHEKLKEAISDTRVEDYMRNAKKVIRKYSIHNKEVQIQYRQLINTIIEQGR